MLSLVGQGRFQDTEKLCLSDSVLVHHFAVTTSRYCYTKSYRDLAALFSLIKSYF